MKKLSLGILIGIVAVVLTVGVAFALPVNKGAEKAKELKGPPEFVVELSEGELTKIFFIRYAPGFQKGKPCDNDGICESGEKGWCADCKGGEEEPSTTACYDFLAGSKPSWNWLEDYYYSDSTLEVPSVTAVGTWEAPVPEDIFGNGLLGNYPWGVYDYTNSVSFNNYPEEGVLGVTAIWFRGKNIYEYDIMLDTDYFPSNFDLPTVVLHEFGHAAGLGDLYDVACIDNVMYGRLGAGEVKATLGSGDIAGIQTLYGI